MKEWILLVLLVMGCTGTPAKKADPNLVEVGDMITVNYVGRTNGKVFDTSIEATGKAAGMPEKPYAPLKFSVGAGQMIEGFDAGVVWMKKGETKEITIPPEKGYGPARPELSRVLPRGENISVSVGDGVELTLGGQSLRGVVFMTNETNIGVDFNHPLAGKTLTFEVTVLGIEKAQK